MSQGEPEVKAGSQTFSLVTPQPSELRLSRSKRGLTHSGSRKPHVDFWMDHNRRTKTSSVRGSSRLWKRKTRPARGGTRTTKRNVPWQVRHTAGSYMVGIAAGTAHRARDGQEHPSTMIDIFELTAVLMPMFRGKSRWLCRDSRTVTSS